MEAERGMSITSARYSCVRFRYALESIKRGLNLMQTDRGSRVVVKHEIVIHVRVALISLTWPPQLGQIAEVKGRNRRRGRVAKLAIQL